MLYTERSMLPSTLPRAISNVKINRMLLTETGRYNPMYDRPYVTDVNHHTLEALTDRVLRSETSRSTSGLIAGLASSIVSPSATPGGMIPIVNGWGERRIRFVMEVEYMLATGSIGIYYVQGYTSHPGVTMTGAVDPNMIFIINSCTNLTRTEMYTPTGRVYRDIVADAAQVFGGSSMVVNPAAPIYGLRPEDIYKGMQSAMLSDGQGVDTSGNIVDVRVHLNGMQAQRSNRINNVPAAYVSKILDGFMEANDLINFGQGSADINTRALHNTIEPSLLENFFFRILSDVNSGKFNGTFSWGELQRIDMDIDAKTKYLTINEASKVGYVHDVGMSEHWTGSNMITQIANILSSAIPALMMETMLSKIAFRSTNHDMTGQVTTTLAGLLSLANIDPKQHGEMFKYRFNTEVIKDITRSNQIGYMLEATCDLFGETWLHLSIDGEPMTTFVVPSFCDSLSVPVIARSLGHYAHVTNDFSHLVNYVTDGSIKANKSSGIRLAPGI